MKEEANNIEIEDLARVARDAAHTAWRMARDARIARDMAAAAYYDAFERRQAAAQKKLKKKLASKN